MGLITAPHDLLQLHPHWTEAEELQDVPSWVHVSLQKTPWVVVRRAPALEGQIAVGVRGQERHLRQALNIPASLIVQKVTPEQLIASQFDSNLQTASANDRWDSMPALQALKQLYSHWHNNQMIWGPTGSAGFELATGHATLTMTSDLDMLLRCSQALDRVRAEQLWQQTLDLPVRVDVQIETPYGAVALSEWAKPATDRVLMRTLQGPVLVKDPWNPRLA